MNFGIEFSKKIVALDDRLNIINDILTSNNFTLDGSKTIYENMQIAYVELGLLMDMLDNEYKRQKRFFLKWVGIIIAALAEVCVGILLIPPFGYLLYIPFIFYFVPKFIKQLNERFTLNERYNNRLEVIGDVKTRYENKKAPYQRKLLKLVESKKNSTKNFSEREKDEYASILLEANNLILNYIDEDEIDMASVKPEIKDAVLKILQQNFNTESTDLMGLLEKAKGKLNQDTLSRTKS